MMRAMCLLMLASCTNSGPGNLWFLDEDEDGWGADVWVQGARPDGSWVAQRGDCDDLDASRHPDAVESCNELDDDCDGGIDEGAGDPWYADADRDGVGSGEVVQLCQATLDYAPVGGDCDDRNPEVYPGAAELCDGLDNDCDSSTPVDVGSSCGVEWRPVEIEGRTFLLSTGLHDAQSARSSCAERGYRLVFVHDAALQNALSEEIAAMHEFGDYWVAARRGQPCDGTEFGWYDPLSGDCSPFSEYAQGCVPPVEGDGVLAVVEGNPFWFFFEDGVRNDPLPAVCELRP